MKVNASGGMLQTPVDPSIEMNYKNLTPAQRKLALNKMNQAQRRALVSLMRDRKTTESNGPIFRCIQVILQEAMREGVELTRLNDGLSILQRIVSKIRALLEEFVYLFNFLSANKTYSLLSHELISQEMSVSSLRQASKPTLLNLMEVASREHISLGGLLQKEGYSHFISGLNFGIKKFKNFHLEGIVFIDCTFSWSHFSQSVFKEVKFSHCRIDNASFMNAQLEKCVFDNCEMRENMFTGASLKGVIFYTCSIISSSFEDASLEDCLFFKDILPGTHFLGANVKNSAIRSCQLQDAVFFDSKFTFSFDDISEKSALLTKPTCVFLIHPEMRGITTPKASMKLDQRAGTIPLRITFQPQKVKPADINHEIESALGKLALHDARPIPQKLLQEIKENPTAYPHSLSIVRKAEILAKNVDSFFLPGGEDVPPPLYGEKIDEQTDWGNDYRRSILELAIINQSFEKGIPLMAICRGFQMVEIYFGAKLQQHIEGHKETQTIQLSKKGNDKGLYFHALKKAITCASVHHQAIPIARAATEYLETVVSLREFVKAAELKLPASVPMVLLQFHPEFYKTSTADDLIREFIDGYINFRMSADNEVFWKIFSDSVKAYQIRKRALIPLIRAFHGSCACSL